MHTEYFLIGGGNKTCLVWGCAMQERTHCAKSLLQDAEQVGFVSHATLPNLTMMGDELCINGILALASQMDASEGSITASGITHAVEYEKSNERVRITFTLPYTRDGDVILFEGIGFLCSTETTVRTKSEFQTLCKKYTVPAFGIITYEGTNITPWVYVQETDSLIQESACGSGSIAFHLITGIQEVIQPTGRIILVTHSGDIFTVDAEVQALT